MNGEDFNALYHRQVDRVYRVGFLFLKNHEDALDVAQTVFMKYLAKPRPFMDLDHEKAWFIRVTRNTCQDILKHWWRKRRTEFDFENSADAPKQELFNEIMTLPVKYSSVLYYHYYEGYSTKEMAILFNLNESTLRSRLAKARTLLRKELCDE